jgi:hypothetical protein
MSTIKNCCFFHTDCCTRDNKRQQHLIGVVKTSHSRFPKQCIEAHLKDKIAGNRLVITCKFEGVDLVAMGYKYNKKKVIHFISTAGAANTFDGDDPYMER